MQSVIKKIQKGMIDEILLQSAYVDIKIQPVNFEKSILIFNSGILGGDDSLYTANTTAYLKDEETIRFFGSFTKLTGTNAYVYLPRCTWQVIEFN